MFKTFFERIYNQLILCVYWTVQDKLNMEIWFQTIVLFGTLISTLALSTTPTTVLQCKYSFAIRIKYWYIDFKDSEWCTMIFKFKILYRQISRVQLILLNFFFNILSYDNHHNMYVLVYVIIIIKQEASDFFNTAIALRPSCHHSLMYILSQGVLITFFHKNTIGKQVIMSIW